MVVEAKRGTKTLLTFCGICGAHCSAKVTIEDGKIVKWEQDKESGFHYLPCATFKGQANKEMNEHPDRLKYPLKRVGARGEGKWQRISWDEALDTIANKFTELKEKYGPQVVAGATGEPRGLEFAWLQRFCTAFGTPNCRTPLALCGAAGNAAGSATFGPGHFGVGLPQEENENLVIVWGSAGTDKTAEARERIKRRVKAGAKLVVIDPRRIGITNLADLWIKPRPNSDSVLAMGLLKVIIDEKLYDKDFIDKWTVGFPELCKEMDKFTLDDVERITWVPKEQIQQVARWYGTIRPGSLRTGMGSFGQGSRGFQGVRTLNILKTIVSPENIPGWGIRPVRTPTISGGKLYLLDKFPRNVELNVGAKHKYAVRSAYIPDGSLVDGILQDKIKALFVMQAEPLMTAPNSKKTYQAWMKLDFLVDANIFMTPTAALADIVLPVATINEADIIGVFTGTRAPRALPKIVDPPGEARSDVMIVNDLAKRLGLGEFFFDSDEDVINFMLGPAGLNWEEMKEKRLFHEKVEKVKEEGGFFTTPSGKAEIYSTRAKEVFDCNPLPTWEDVQPVYNPSEEYPLVLTSFEDSDFHLSKFKEVRYFRRFKPYPTVQIHPEVAEKIGATDGNWIWIETKVGKIMQKLIVDPELDPRVVMATFGWYFPEDPTNACQWDKSNINVLLPDEPVEPASGAVDTRGFPCRIYKAEASEVNLPEYIEGVRAV